jgi:hypothetical protein
MAMTPHSLTNTVLPTLKANPSEKINRVCEQRIQRFFLTLGMWYQTAVGAETSDRILYSAYYVFLIHPHL